MRIKLEGSRCYGGFHGAFHTSKERGKDLVKGGGGGVVPLAAVVVIWADFITEKMREGDWWLRLKREKRKGETLNNEMCNF